MITVIKRNPLKFFLVMVVWILQAPFVVMFYVLRSAWQDSVIIGWWLAPERKCEHGVDVVREHCEACYLRELQEEEAENLRRREMN